jgi:hypothetical protein
MQDWIREPSQGQTGMEADRPTSDLARPTRYHKTTVQAEEGMDCEER